MWWCEYIFSQFVVLMQSRRMQWENIGNALRMIYKKHFGAGQKENGSLNENEDVQG